ncbi:ABC transporter ATP-binding protein [Clostridium sp. 'deep sea']|uniref:ABC transporter ATP-binding protein n=1 Tax=Clostridium sp. 'deep sea' TaxID=2779445 RepID=UPI00189645C4|nr:ABC transporter ATP-binding protein [Clostridium sp. 'deep sea']QOR35078.1 ABC transporter ATP-binding protein [Clostridium sp. 'deep sea']
MKNKNWLKTIIECASICKFKLTLSVIFAIISVAGSLIPYIGVYQILQLFIKGTANVQNILYWSAICLLGYMIKIIFHGISTVISHISAYTILEQIRLKIINKMMKAPLGSVLNQTSGKLKNIIVDRVETIEIPLAHMIPEGISNIVLPIVVFCYLFTIDWRMALSSLATVPIAAVSCVFLMRNFNKQYADYMKTSNYVNSVIVEYVSGIEVIKAFSQSNKSYEKFSNAVKMFRDYTLAWFHSTWKLLNFTTVILPSSLLGTIPMGLYLYSKSIINPAEFAICLILSLGIIAPLMWFTTAINDMKAIEYAVNDAQKLLDLNELPNCTKEVKLTNYDIKLNNVSFSYTGENGEVKALNKVNLTIPQSQFTALVGPSGSGKSTVARLVSRFWDVDTGSIELSGINIKNIPLQQLSNSISYVNQNNFLFNSSLLENIRLGNPSASDEQVYEAAKRAQCDEFIKRLKNGYHTTAGEAGGKLSGGERQRIAIARAILKNAPIVILDEATAFTDPENEHKIQKSIAELTKGKTLLVIAHRLSTVKDANQIVVMNNGEVVQSGKQQELLASCQLYNNMWQSHIGAKQWAAGYSREEQAHVSNN